MMIPGLDGQLPGIGGKVLSGFLKKKKAKKAKKAAAAQAAQQAAQAQQLQAQQAYGCVPPRLQQRAYQFFGAARSPAQVDALRCGMQRGLMAQGFYTPGAALRLNQMADVRKLQLASGLP